MADQGVVHIGENSPEYVALRLFELIRTAENRGDNNSDRAYILNTYEECLLAIKNPHTRK